MVQRCRHRPRNHPPCFFVVELGGDNILDFFENCKIDSCICGCWVDNTCIDDAVYEAALDSFCGEKYCDFLQLSPLLSNIRGVDDAENVKQLLRCHNKLKRHVAVAAFLGGSMLENLPHHV